MKDWLEKCSAQMKNKKLGVKAVVYIGLLGMALILASELFAGAGAATTNTTTESATTQTIVNNSEEITTATISTEETYRANLEESLTALISQMEGAGETVVMVTLVSGEEVVYAQNITQNDTQNTQSHVLLDDGSALSETVLTPTVCGVAVLCQGGDSITVKANIIELVTVLFDISSTRVSVEKLG